MTTVSGSAAGLLLAAGAGRRIGGPKALRHDADGTSWLLRAVGVLRDGGCAPIVAVLGAAADEAAELLTGDTVRTVVTADWDEGMGASLRAEIEGLAEAARRKRGRQMEIASRWAAGDTEADFSIQVFGDGEGRMRRDPFLPKEPLPAPPTDNLSRLLRSFREAVSSALYR